MKHSSEMVGVFLIGIQAGIVFTSGWQTDNLLEYIRRQLKMKSEFRKILYEVPIRNVMIQGDRY